MSCFSVLRESASDGHDFAALALERGACAVVAERDMPHLPKRVRVARG